MKCKVLQRATKELLLQRSSKWLSPFLLSAHHLSQAAGFLCWSSRAFPDAGVCCVWPVLLRRLPQKPIETLPLFFLAKLNLPKTDPLQRPTTPPTITSYPLLPSRNTELAVITVISPRFLYTLPLRSFEYYSAKACWSKNSPRRLLRSI